MVLFEVLGRKLCSFGRAFRRFASIVASLLLARIVETARTWAWEACGIWKQWRRQIWDISILKRGCWSSEQSALASTLLSFNWRIVEGIFWSFTRFYLKCLNCLSTTLWTRSPSNFLDTSLHEKRPGAGGLESRLQSRQQTNCKSNAAIASLNYVVATGWTIHK